MSGHIRRRGKRSWELKFDLSLDQLTGVRATRYHSFKGSKREAEAELTRLMADAARGGYVNPSKMTLGEFLDKWQKDWAQSNLGQKSFERYDDLLKTHVRPRLGSLLIQKVKVANLASLYTQLLLEGRKGPGTARGLSPRTVAYLHRVLHRAFGHAMKWGLISTNPASSVDPPRSVATEKAILTEEQVREVVRKLRGRPMYMLAIVGLATGMRRGELLALRWKDVDLGKGRVTVARSLEQTRTGLKFKQPKTKHGRRTISVPQSIIRELRAHRRTQVEQRLALGLGKGDDEALVFPRLDGEPMIPNSVTTEWRRLVRTLKLPAVTLHAWRHTHASQLIASGMDVLTISRRLGHGSASITLDVYGHLFHTTDDRAASVFEDAFGRVLAE